MVAPLMLATEGQILYFAPHFKKVDIRRVEKLKGPGFSALLGPQIEGPPLLGLRRLPAPGYLCSLFLSHP